MPPPPQNQVDAITGIISTVAGNTSNGRITRETNRTLYLDHYTGDGGLATNASLLSPTGLAFNAAGDLFIADMGNGAVRRCAKVVSPRCR